MKEDNSIHGELRIIICLNIVIIVIIFIIIVIIINNSSCNNWIDTNINITVGYHLIKFYLFY